MERAARSDDVRGEGPHAIAAGGVDLVLVRTKSGIKVYEGRCPHQGALLGEGELEGGSLVCRNHRWRFDLETGQRTGGRQCLRSCTAREEGGEILVDVAPFAASVQAKAPATPLRRLEDLPGPPDLPIVGNAFQIRRERAHLDFEAWSREYGPMYRLRLGPRDIVVHDDPALAEPMLRARPETYRRPSPLEPLFEEMGLAGVFSAEGPAWRPQRKLAMEALSQRHLRGFYPTLERVARRLYERWRRAAESGRVLDLADELKLFTVDVTTLLVFGHDVDTLGTEDGDGDVIQRHLEHVFPSLNRRLFAIFPYWRWLRLPEDRRLDHALRELRAWLTPFLDEARERLVGEPERADSPANFLESMLAARDPEGRPFSNDVIFGNAMTMLLAGEDTTAYSLAWAVHHLLDAPRAVSELVNEVDEVLGAARVPADLEHANRLPYATAVANEAMRLRPVAPTLTFEANHDVVVGDLAAPKGTTFIFLTRRPATSEAHFDEPLAFRPERWIAGPSSGKTHDASVAMPFGSGPRICPGRSLALLEMRVVLATLYRSFDVERVGPAEDVREMTAFTMVPVGLRVKLKKRG
jgi:cytochrome P450/nitrite reductase/ring-hydroxylating ferredoxin subunit